jgi:hypothetical protein
MQGRENKCEGVDNGFKQNLKLENTRWHTTTLTLLFLSILPQPTDIDVSVKIRNK